MIGGHGHVRPILLDADGVPKGLGEWTRWIEVICVKLAESPPIAAQPDGNTENARARH